MKKEKQMQEKTRGTGKITGTRIAVAVMTFAMLFAMNGFYSYADTGDIGKNAGNWILDQLFWVGLIALAIGLISCLIKKAWVAAIITGLAGGVVLVLIRNPELLSTWAENIVHTVLGG